MRVSLSAARVNAGHTQESAAAKAGISKRSLCAYECGVRVPKLKTLCRLCEIYGCKIDDIKILP